MKVQSNGPASGPGLSVVFVDYDNIYLSLKRKNEEAARRFSKDAGGWLRGIETGRLISSTQGIDLQGPRRIVLNRCYGNPSPRRNPTDNSTDMNSFPFVRHHFLRAGFEVVDCPPLTAQLKNSADIKMVMDVLDFLKHQTYFDEFVLLSGDADFTPVLHRLRAHARRTVVYANDHTATPYTAISDGEVREADLITLLMEGRVSSSEQSTPLIEKQVAPQQLEQLASRIVSEVMSSVQSSAQPVPLEALADRAVRALGHDNTIGTNWAGAGSFRDLLTRKLPSALRMSEQAPYYVFDASRQVQAEVAAREPRRIEAREPARPAPPANRPAPRLESAQPAPRKPAPPAGFSAPGLSQPGFGPPSGTPVRAPAAGPPAVRHAAPADAESPTQIQQSIARIHEASQAPPLSPPDYRALFEAMAEEITANGLTGAHTLGNIAQRALQHGAEVHLDDIRFVMEIVSEPDPWFEQGASPVLLANRFRNYVIAQCRRKQMQLSATEIDLIEMWFTGSGLQSAVRPAPQRPDVQQPRHDVDPGYRPRGPAPSPVPAMPQAHQPPPGRPVPPKQDRSERWWHLDGTEPEVPEQREGEDFPRFMRPRVRS